MESKKVMLDLSVKLDSTNPINKNMPAKAKLVNGPTRAILNSFRKSLVSSSISETPPKIKSRIWRTPKPYLRDKME